jgi:beta-galactosidase
MKLRSLNATYLKYVDAYFDRLIPIMLPLQYSQGGPIVLVQVEDDTTIKTSSVADNRAYYKYLVDGTRKRGLSTLVNTLCYPTPTECERAYVEGAILAVEMPYWVPPFVSFDVIRFFYPVGPLIVVCVDVTKFEFFFVTSFQMETYSGWFDLEGKAHQTLAGNVFVPHMQKILETRNASLSIYMA